MKYQFSVFLITIMVFLNYSYTQSCFGNNFGINWSGFVTTDFMFDTHQTVNVGEGYFNTRIF